MQFKSMGQLFSTGGLKEEYLGMFGANPFANISSMQDLSKDQLSRFNQILGVGENGISKYTVGEIQAKTAMMGFNDALALQSTGIAKDADLIVKARANHLTYRDALSKNTGSIQEFGDALENSNLLQNEQKNLLKDAKASNFDEYEAAVRGLINDNDEIGDSLIALEENVGKSSMFSGAKNLGRGMLSMAKAVLPYVAAIAAVAGAFYVFDKSQTKFTQANNKASESISKYQQSQSELNSLNEELTTTKEKISELQALKSAGTITFAQEGELETLKNQNDELERRLKIKQQLVETDKQAAINDTENAMDTEQSYYDYLKQKNGGGIVGSIKAFFGMGNAKRTVDENGVVKIEKESDDWKKQSGGNTDKVSQFEGLVKQLEEQKQALKDFQTSEKSAKLSSEDFSKKQKELQDDISDTTTELASSQEQLQTWRDALTDENGVALSGDAKKYIDLIDRAFTDYTNIGKSKKEKQASILDTYFNSSTGSVMKDYLKKLAKDGVDATEALSKFRETGMTLRDIDPSMSESAFKRYFEGIKREAQEAEDAVSGFDGTFDSLQTASETANQGANYDATMGFYKTAKEMYKKGLWGTDDFKSMAQFGVGYNIEKKIKDNPGVYKFNSDAYKEAFEQGQALLERWYGNEDELVNMQNVLADFKKAGLASNTGDEWSFVNEDGSMKFKTTAEAAEKLHTSVSNVETAMSKLEEHGFEFDGIEKSGELLGEYKDNLDKLKETYDTMKDGDEKDRLKKLIDSYDDQYSKFEDDLSGLSEDQIINIKFEYDLSDIESKIQDLQEQAYGENSNEAWSALIVEQQNAIDMLEKKNAEKYGEDFLTSDAGYSSSKDKIEEIKKQRKGSKGEERAAYNERIAAVQDMEEAFQKYKFDGGELNWSDYLNTNAAKKAFDEILENGNLTADDLKDLFGDGISVKIDTDITDLKSLEDKVNALKDGETITFKADVDNIEDTLVTVTKNEDGTVTYTADVGGVEKDVNLITDKDGKIRYTAEFDGTSEEWLQNNLDNDETITFNANVEGVQKVISAYKNEDGTITYEVNMGENGVQRLKEVTDEQGNITFVVDNSSVDQAVNDSVNKVEGANPELKVTADTSEADKKIESFRGEVDLTNRPQINAQKLKDVGWDNAGDGTATVFSSAYSNEKGNKTIVVTPILPNGDVYEPGALEKYANGLLNGAKDTEGLGIRTYIGQDSIDQANKYAEALHKVQESYYLGDDAQKSALQSLSAYDAQQLKSIDLYDDKTGSIENSLTSLMGSLGIGRESLSEFIDVLSDMNLIKEQHIDTDIGDPNTGIVGYKDNDKNQIVMSVEADTSQIDNQLSQLQQGQTLQFTANVDESSIEQSIEAYRDEDGTIHYRSTVDQTELYQYTDEDGTIHYTADPNVNTSAVDAVKNEEGTIHYTADSIVDASQINTPTIPVNVMANGNVDVSQLGIPTLPVQPNLLPVDGSLSTIPVNVSMQNTPADETKTVTYNSSIVGDKPKNETKQLTYNITTSGSLPGNKTRTLTYTIKTEGKAPALNGTANPSGSSFLNGTAFAHGTENNESRLQSIKNKWRTNNSQLALTGEVGRELVVTKDNRWYTVGDNGAEFAPIPAGSVVFNSRQTEELLKNGHTNSRASGNPQLSGLADLNGTAFWSGGRMPSSGGGGGGNNGKSNSKSSSSNSNSNSSSDTSKAEENLTDWIKVLLDRTSRITDLAVDAIDRAIGLINKQVKAADSISKVQNEIKVNQQAAQKYLDYANQVGLSEAYKKKVQNGELSIENISDETLRDQVSKYQDYYESYLDAQDKVLDLEDKLTELAEKRLSIIEDEYDAIVDVNDALKDISDSKMDFNDAYGVARDNQDNYDSINKAITAQEDTYNQLTTKLAEYQKEVESQLNSGLMKKGSEQYYDAMKNINDFTAKMYDAQKELLDWQDKLTQIKLDTIQGVIDIFERRVSKLDKYASLLDSRDEAVPEEVYQEQIDGNNSQILKMYEKRAELLKQQSFEDVNSEAYEKYAEDIQKLDESILDMQEDNEKLKDSIYELRIQPLEDAIEKYGDLEDELKNFRDILNDDAFVDKQGGITDEGLAQIALLQQSIGNAKQKISDYTTGLQKIKELYDNGVISLKEYNEKSKEYRDGIQDSIGDIKDYKDNILDLYQNAMKTEVDYLNDIIDKRKQALKAKADYYDYDKKIKDQTKDVNTIKAQIQALEGVKVIAPVKSI